MYRTVPYRYMITQCCGAGAGADSRGAEIKLPPGAGAEITNFGSGSFLFTGTTDFKKFYRKIMVPEEVFLNYYHFNPITEVKRPKR
jgi:hypothetical protein